MKKITFPVSGCYSCPDYSYSIQNMRICNGGKRLRRFGTRDPKKKAPAWCPRRNSPAIVRVYRLKDDYSRALHFQFAEMRQTDETQYAYPHGHHYIQVHEERRQITASHFYECAKNHEAQIEFELEYGDVVEIDDGLTPYFFYLKAYQTFLPSYFTPPVDEAAKRKKGKT